MTRVVGLADWQSFTGDSVEFVARFAGFKFWMGLPMWHSHWQRVLVTAKVKLG
jgi:hypothetical protein